ncbi:MAG: hypothetical protein UY13_C0001G0011 [Candidatus Pacebacteria bacterium GW2011_GWB1_47_8]|nr:MAG: hypothetical protein UX28_C0003G0059 [Candidatus Pacebacteria bacterium GW2011_GWA1_46_10]KKU84689.1 MAG: hypothetical protein UY13_C0001G0011 [Candidatus Pacebacteria bacterium GW2011_GWB1_47_8]HCR80864.1 hypothetical protein [Candidatus Paceibacterota bacterium]
MSENESSKQFTSGSTEEEPQSSTFSQFSEKTQRYLRERFKNEETLELKLSLLTEAGFGDPTSLIERFPNLIALDIKRVVGDLKGAGFNDLVSLITEFPQFAGYNIGRVRKYLRLVRVINKVLNLDYEPVAFVENFPRLLSFSVDELLFFLRVSSHYRFSEKNYYSVLKFNPFLVFGDILNNPTTLHGITTRIVRLSKAEKLERIEQVKALLPGIDDFLERKNYTPAHKTFLRRLAANLRRLAAKR